jgi:hypothetical protein
MRCVIQVSCSTSAFIKIVIIASKTGTDKNHLRLETFEPGDPQGADEFTTVHPLV